jgi:ATP-dependent DNA helicase RecG
MEPVIRPELQLFELEGKALVVAEIPELPASEKPCFYRSAGLVNGAFFRVGDGDRQMTPYEVQACLDAKGQPRYDLEPMAEATIQDLDAELLAGFLRRLRQRSFQSWSDEEILRTLKVLVPDAAGHWVPSLAGLLCFGRYPQAFFPGLFIAVNRYPGQSAGELGPNGERFLDSVKVEGPIPYMIRDALQALKRNMQLRIRIPGLGRQEDWEYPELVLREALVNALVHRDYSPQARGTHVKIQLFSQRLEILNPGGLFGPVSADLLGQAGLQSSRNAFLIRMMEDLPLPEENRPLCEGRGSGIVDMLGRLRQVGLSPPLFDITLARFRIEFQNHTLMAPDTLAWLTPRTQGYGLNERQLQALAFLKHRERLTNADYCRLTGADSRLATQELRALVNLALVDREGSHRWSAYRLTSAMTAAEPQPKGVSEQGVVISAGPVARAQEPGVAERILTLLGQRPSPILAQEIAEQLGINRSTVDYHVRRLLQQGRLERIARAHRSPQTRYRSAEQNTER